MDLKLALDPPFDPHALNINFHLCFIRNDAFGMRASRWILGIGLRYR